MPSPRRIDDHELENLRRSLGACGGLPRDQVERLIDEVHRLLVERKQILKLIENIRTSWPELRRSLNDLDALVRGRRRPPA